MQHPSSLSSLLCLFLGVQDPPSLWGQGVGFRLPTQQGASPEILAGIWKVSPSAPPRNLSPNRVSPLAELQNETVTVRTSHLKTRVLSPPVSQQSSVKSL